MTKYKTLYDRLKPRYMNLLLSDNNRFKSSIKQAKKGLKSKDYFIELTVHELDRLSMILELDITNKNVHRLFDNDNALRF